MADEIVILPLPSTTVFHDHLLVTMSQRTGQNPAKGVSPTEAIEEVLAKAGYDQKNLPAGWSKWESNGKGLYTRVLWTAKVLRVKGWMLKGNESPEKGLWYITPAGITAAEPLLPPPPVEEEFKRNTTAEWFNQHLTPGRGHAEAPLLSQMKAALRRHLPVSHRAGMVEDHVHTYIERAIRRDAFARHLQEGKLTYGQVTAYCVNSGRSDARNMGTDPVCRELLGARTEQERRKGRSLVDEDATIPMDTDGNPIFPESASEHSSDAEFQGVWKRIEMRVMERKPKAGERYANLLLLKVQGLSLDEIAKAEGVSRNRAASMLADVRKMLRGEEMSDLF